VSGDGELGFALHIQASDIGRCEEIKNSMYITDPNGDHVHIHGTCGEVQDEWERDNSPPLRKLGHIGLKEENGVKLYGAYIIMAPAKIWVVDSAEELGEAVGGILASLGIIAGAIVLFIIACILCCVGCCCLGPEQGQVQVLNQPPGAVGQTVVVVGQKGESQPLKA